MKRSLFILYTMFFFVFVNVAHAKRGGTIVVSENDPSIQVQYEQPPNGWVSKGTDAHSWILFKNIGYLPNQTDDVTELSEKFHYDMSWESEYDYVDIDYGYIQHVDINLRTDINGGGLSENRLRNYLQTTMPGLEFLERKFKLDGYDGLEFFSVVYDTTHQINPPHGVWDPPFSKLDRYILLNLTDTQSLLIKVSGYASVHWEGESISTHTRRDAIKEKRDEFDQIALSGFEKLIAEVDQILNEFQIEVDGKQPRGKEEESQEKGTVWELMSTDVRLYDNPGELGKTNPFGDARITNSGTWSQPPQFLYPGETDSLFFWLEEDSVNQFIDGRKISSNNDVTKVEIEGQDWKVPVGNPGDKLALTFSVRAADDSDAGTVVFFYNFKTYTKTDKVDGDEVDDTDGFGTDEEGFEDLLDEFPGLGDIGPIPGPDTIKQALAGVVAPAILIAILSALGQLGGSAPGTGGGSPVPPNQSPNMTLTDALGRDHEYEWSPDDGGYINPETGGMLDPTLWEEYNSGLAANQAFNERQREKIAQRDTDFDRQVDKLLEREKQREILMKDLEALKKSGYRLGPDGGRASVHADKLLVEARRGEPVSSKQVAAVKRFIRDREAGRTEVESDRQIASELDLDIVKETFQGSVRTAITAKNPDGTISWPAMVTRIGIAIKTGGASEYVMIPAESGYIVKDCMDQGASVGEAVATAGVVAVASAVAGKVIAGGLGVVAKGAGWAARGAAKAAGKYLPATSSAAKQAAKWLGKGVAGLGKEFKQVGKFAKDGARAGAKKVGLGGTRMVAKQSARSTLTLTQKKLQQTFTKAVAEGDEQALIGLYKNGGMRKLAALERAGHMNATQVKAANTIMSRNMKQAIREGTESSVERFERKTGYKIKEVLLGDSGSSAKGTARSILTDYDRTVIASFDDDVLDEYARKKGLTIHHKSVKKYAELNKMTPANARLHIAEKDLSKKFVETHSKEVGLSVQRKLGVNAAKDLDYAAYNGIGSGAGPTDSYPLGFTNARQSILGTGTRTYRAANGQLRTHVVSGDTIVDANAFKSDPYFKSAKMPAKLAPAPTRIVKEEMPALLKQQVQSAASHRDAKSLAKAVGRANYVAQRAKLKTNPGLSRVAKQIFDNPQKMKTILQQNGLSEVQFVTQSRQLINNLADQLG